MRGRKGRITLPIHMVEVLSVRSLTFDGAKEIYGTIKLWDSLVEGTSLIFDRGKREPQLLATPHDVLTLNGPSEKAVKFENILHIEFNLTDKKQEHPYIVPLFERFKLGETAAERDFYDGDYIMCSFPDDPWCFDKILRKVYTTDCGLWEVKFVLYSCAVQATVQLFLVNWKGKESKETMRVYGKVTACNKKFRECAEITLLDMYQDDEPLCVNVGQKGHGNGNGLVALSRSLAVVPSSSFFYVDGSIWLHPDDSDYDDDNFVVASGRARFHASKHGQYHSIIPGKLADIHVRVAWAAYSL